MPSGISTFAAQKWLPLLFGIGSYPANYYACLLTQPPPASYDGASLAQFEPDDLAYHRQVMGTGGAWWTVGTGGLLTSVSAVSYPVPTADWGYVTHVALCDAASGGNLYCWGEIRNPQKVLQGIAPVIPAGSLVMSMPTG